MNKVLLDYLILWGVSDKLAKVFTAIIMVLFISILCVIANFFVKKTLNKVLVRLIKRTGRGWEEILLKRKVFDRIALLVTPLIISFFIPIFLNYATLIKRSLVIYSIGIILMIIDAALNAADDIYRTFEISKTKPIKGFLQVVKIIIFLMGGTIGLAAILGESPLIILGGFSAMTAVLLLIFQNSILGFVAGIQLTSNDMVRIGDWIDLPKHNASGNVVDLSLNTVKIQNFDYTISYIPAHLLVSDSFINWRGMQESGGRRIKRSINIDMSSILFCTEEMLEKYKKIDLLTDYIEEKQKEIGFHNQIYSESDLKIMNGRNLTNIGTFRFYIYNYLKKHPSIREDMSLMVRQLAPTEKGLPLEIYAFANRTNWELFENIQSDIFDHILAIIEQFDLRIFQELMGADIKNFNSNTHFE